MVCAATAALLAPASVVCACPSTCSLAREVSQPKLHAVSVVSRGAFDKQLSLGLRRKGLKHSRSPLLRRLTDTNLVIQRHEGVCFAEQVLVDPLEYLSGTGAVSETPDARTTRAKLANGVNDLILSHEHEIKVVNPHQIHQQQMVTSARVASSSTPSSSPRGRLEGGVPEDCLSRLFLSCNTPS